MKAARIVAKLWRAGFTKSKRCCFWRVFFESGVAHFLFGFVRNHQLEKGAL